MTDQRSILHADAGSSIGQSILRAREGLTHPLENLGGHRPGPPVFHFCPLLPDGRVLPTHARIREDLIAGTYSRASSGYVFDGQYQRWRELPIDAPRVHGAYHVANLVDPNYSGDGGTIWNSDNGNSVTDKGNGVTEFEYLGAGAGDTANVFHDTLSGVDVSERSFAISVELRRAPGGPGGMVRIRSKRISGGSFNSWGQYDHELTREWVRVAAGFSVHAALDPGAAGVRLLLEGSAGGGTATRWQIRNPQIEEVPPDRAAASGAAVPGPIINPGTSGAWWRMNESTVSDPANNAGEISEVAMFRAALLHPVRYQDRRIFPRACPVAARATAYTTGQCVRPDGLRPYNDGAAGAAYDQVSYFMVCVTAGTSHATNTINGDLWTAATTLESEIIDGTCVWRVSGRMAPGGLLGMWFEPDSTSEGVTDARDASDVFYGFNGTVATAAGIDGQTRNLSAEDINADSPGDYDRLFAAFTIAATVQDWTGSIFIRKQETDHVSFFATLFVPSFTAEGRKLDLRTGELATVAGLASGTSKIEDWGEWWRLVSTLNNALGETTIAFMFQPARGPSLAVDDETDLGEATFDFPMAEPGSYATSPIYALGQTTRSRDAPVAFSAAAMVPPLDLSSMLCRAQVQQLGPGSRIWQHSDPGAAVLYSTTGNILGEALPDAVSVAPFGWSARLSDGFPDPMNWAVNFAPFDSDAAGADKIRANGNGTAALDDFGAGAWGSAGGTHYIGSQATANAFSGIIGSVAGYPRSVLSKETEELAELGEAG